MDPREQFCKVWPHKGICVTLIKSLYKAINDHLLKWCHASFIFLTGACNQSTAQSTGHSHTLICWIYYRVFYLQKNLKFYYWLKHKLAIVNQQNINIRNLDNGVQVLKDTEKWNTVGPLVKTGKRLQNKLTDHYHKIQIKPTT